MEFTNSYLNFKPTYKYYYIKNNFLEDKNFSTEDLFTMIHQDIDLIFDYLKISPSRLGYRYWKDAILICIFSEKDHPSICYDIYPMIAKKYNKSVVSVERAMRICFEATLYNSKHETNFIINFMKHFLINPQNSKVLMKLVELVVSAEFRRFKKSIISSSD